MLQWFSSIQPLLYGQQICEEVGHERHASTSSVAQLNHLHYSYVNVLAFLYQQVHLAKYRLIEKIVFITLHTIKCLQGHLSSTETSTQGSQMIPSVTSTQPPVVNTLIIQSYIYCLKYTQHAIHWSGTNKIEMHGVYLLWL